MTTKTWQRIFSYLVLAGLLLSLTYPGAAQAKISVVDPAARAASQTAQAKIEQQVLEELAAKGQTDFIVVMKDQADLSATSSMKTKVEKGDFVYNTLRVTADRTQKGLRTYLDKQGAKYTSYYIVNAILVSGGTQDLLMGVAARSDVASVSANHMFTIKTGKAKREQAGPEAPATVEPNLAFVNADDVWALGDTGQGTVLAGNDTGLLWTHPAIQSHYRGWNGVTADHNYNWWSAVPGSYPQPMDSTGMGTFTAGVMVGDDGAGNQIGMAPGAKTIHCRNTNWADQSQDTWYIECFEWDLAPWDLAGNNPRPDLAPDAVNVSWNYSIGGDNDLFGTAVDNLLAAGIVVDAPAGDSGSSCSSLYSPGDYQEVLTTGSVYPAPGNALPGTITNYSSRGPSELDGNYFPDVMAPGQNIRSSSIWLPYYPYTTRSTTKAANPHITGLIGLMWSANPALRGMVDATMQIIKDTAVPLTGQQGSNCGGDYIGGPNNDWGFGTIDALAAVQMARFYQAGTLEGAVTQSVGGAPIQGAAIQATMSITQSYQTTTDLAGLYAMTVLSGTYSVDATAFGYLPAEASGVVVTQDMTTTLDFALDVAPSHLLSVTVVDANTGWPLYAVTSLGGTPLNPVWNNPLTGHFEEVLPDGWVYTLGVDAWTPGYLHQNVTVGPFYTDTEVTVELQPDQVSCNAPGYEFVLHPALTSDFEANNGGFYIAGSNPSWERGAPINGPGAAHSGSNVWATSLDGNYNNNEDSYLFSPVIDLSSQAGNPVVVSWWQWLQTQQYGDYAALQVSNDGGIDWMWVYGYVYGDVDLSWAKHTLVLDPSFAVGNFQMRFHLWSDGSVNYPGWYIDDVNVGANVCTPMAGGLVVGNVSDANEGMPVTDATVANDSGFSTLTAATADPAIADAFYVLFSPAGSHEFTASYDSYTPDLETVDVAEGRAIWQDFVLTAGHLVFDPHDIKVSLDMGSSLTQTLTITNNGSSPASFAIAEIANGFVPATSADARTVVIPAAAGQPPAGTQVAKWPAYQPRPALTIHIPAAPAEGPDVLIVCADDNPCEPLASQLMAFGDLSSVTSFDARYATPTLAELKAYDVVLTWNNWNYADPSGLGDEMADYVDAGGKVINLMYALNPWGLQGRFADENYTAMKGPDNLFNYACLGTYDASHPIMAGITNVCDSSRLLGAYLTPDSTAVASWADGEIFVAVKDNHTVVSLATYLGYWSNMTGQGDAVVHNAIGWLTGPSEVPWVSEQPITATVPVSNSQAVQVVFDAGVREITLPGSYHARLRISSDTPYPATTISLTLSVTVPPTYGKLEGTVQGLGYCNGSPSSLSQADVFIQSSLGTTWTLKTDANGYYQMWMDQANSPITITVTDDYYAAQTVTGVAILAQQTTKEDFGLKLLEPCVSVAPPSLSATVDIGSLTTTLMTLDNTGAKASTFAIRELNGGYNPSASAVHIPAGDSQLRYTPGHFGPAPRSTAPTPGGASAAQVISTLAGEPAYAVDAYYDDLVYIPNTTQPWYWNWIGGTYNTMYGGDFLNGDFSKMYAVNYQNNALYTIDTADATTTLIGPAVPQNYEVWTGLTGTSYGVLYGSATDGETSTLYTLNPATGAPTVVGPITNAPCIIDIAINAFGEMYGVDICYDALVRINPSTGAGTLVGSLGVDADYAQGMDFEDQTGILYWASWNYNVYGGELRVIDTTTGNSTSIGGFPGYDEVDCLAFATQGPTEVLWLSEQPVTGTLAADIGHQDVTITFDASVVAQPGEYYASLSVKNDDPYNGAILVPVDMIVNPTADWGMLEGTVTGLGYCDHDPAPLEGAQITIAAASGVTYTVKTDGNGYYQRWLKVADGPYTVSVSAEGHASGSVENVAIPGLGVITEDFNLRWLEPCVRAAPAGINVDVPMGNITTTQLTLSNTGAEASPFAISERDGGYTPISVNGAGPQITPRPLLPGFDPNAFTTQGVLGPGGAPATNLLGGGAVLAKWSTGLVLPWGTGFNLNQDKVWFSDLGAAGGDDYNHEYAVDGTPTGRTVYSRFDSGSWSADLAFNPNTGKFWQVNVGGDNCLYEWDPAGGATGNKICGPWDTSERGVAYDPDTDTFYVGGWNDGTVYHIDSAGNLLNQWYFGMGISGLAFNPQAGLLFIIENSYYDTVYVFDVSTSSFIDSFDIPGFGGGSGAGLEIDCDGNLWAANQVDGNAYLVDSGVPANLCQMDAPWLSENPITGTLAADTGLQPITLTLDASVVSQPGQYLATLDVRTADPINRKISVPVTMTVQPTADWGALVGTVNSLGYCDTNPAPLAGAEVLIESASGVTYTVETDANGGYSRWLKAADGPYIVSVIADEHTFGFAPGVVIISMQTTTQNFNLRWLAPCVSADPSLFNVQVGQGYSLMQQLGLVNGGAAGSSFKIVEKAGTPLTGLKSNGSNHTVTEAKNKPQGTAPSAGVLGGGPDPFGYEFADSNEVGGPSYDWIEIAPPAGGAGTSLNMNGEDDDYYWPLDLPFAFNFYGTDYNQISVQSNGGLGFDNNYLTLSHQPIPGYTNNTNTFIAHLWDDQYIYPGEVYYLATDEMTVIEYYHVSHCCASPDYGTWEIILYPNGNILLQYEDVTFGSSDYDYGANATVGIQGDPSTGLQYSYDTPSLSAGLAICFAYPGNSTSCTAGDVPWLAEDPITGTVSHDSALPVDVTFTAFPTMTVGSVFTASLAIETDDPMFPKINVPVTMTVVSPRYGLAISPDNSLTGAPGETVTYDVVITNESNGPPDSFSLSLSASQWMTVLDVEQVGPLAPGESATVHVSVTVPLDVVLPDHDTVQVTATSQGDPAVSATASLTTVAGGSFGVDLEPEASAGSGRAGDVITYTLRLTNTGMTTGTIDVSVAGAGAAWVTLPQDSFVLAGGEAVEVIVVVTIPADAAAGDYPVTVTATCVNDPLQTDEVLITTTVIQSYIYLPLIWRAP